MLQCWKRKGVEVEKGANLCLFIRCCRFAMVRPRPGRGATSRAKYGVSARIIALPPAQFSSNRRHVDDKARSNFPIAVGSGSVVIRVVIGVRLEHRILMIY